MHETRLNLIYICSSQFSGSTLLSFLLNTHPEITTIGHTTGWKYAADEDFRCSCGETIRECQLFRKVAAAYCESDLQFDPTNFGTAFKASENQRLDQLLTGPIPGIRSDRLEEFRDNVVSRIGSVASKLLRQEKANKVLISAVLEASEARFYVDNSHSPYRLKRLAKRIATTAYPLHLVRDPRGVALSMMSNSGYKVDEAIHSWLKHQQNVIRICEALGNYQTVRYEDICRTPNKVLFKIHRWIGVQEHSFSGDFKEKPHHILGNRMRTTSSKIRLDERWKADLSKRDREFIERRLRQSVSGGRDSMLAKLIDSYLSCDETGRIE